MRVNVAANMASVATYVCATCHTRVHVISMCDY